MAQAGIISCKLLPALAAFPVTLGIMPFGLLHYCISTANERITSPCQLLPLHQKIHVLNTVLQEVGEGKPVP